MLSVRFPVSFALTLAHRSLSFVLSALAFNVLPTLAEIGLVCGVLGYTFGAPYAIIAVGTLTTYIGFTVAITTWRTKFRKDMNAFENQASSIAFDSLLNYETVKYCQSRRGGADSVCERIESRGGRA
jgi:ATP-binding cassette subfamily B (MDR/TAP) protein 7